MRILIKNENTYLSYFISLLFLFLLKMSTILLSFVIIIIFFFILLISIYALNYVSREYFSKCSFSGEKLFESPEELFPVNKKITIPHFTKKQFQSKYSQKIPFNIIQTHFTREIPFGMNYTIQRNLDINPEYDHYFFSDEEARDFIEKHFDERTLLSYDTLVPGAYKADLFRLCAIYILGGIYIDAGMGSIRPFRSFISENDELILTKDWNEYVLPGIYRHKDKVYNAILIAKENHPIIKKNIEIINDNVEKKVYPGLFSITGPITLMNSVNDSPGFNIKWLQHLILKNAGEDCLNGVICDSDNKYLLFNRYNGYRRDTKIIDKKGHYTKIYRQRNVYGEKRISSSEVKSLSQQKENDGSLLKTKFVRDYYNIVENEEKELSLSPLLDGVKRVLYQGNNENHLRFCREMNGECEFILIPVNFSNNKENIRNVMDEMKCDYFISDERVPLKPFRKILFNFIDKEKIFFINKNQESELSNSVNFSKINL